MIKNEYLSYYIISNNKSIMTTKQIKDNQEYQPSRDLLLQRECEELSYKLISDKYEILLKLLTDIAELLGYKIKNLITFKYIDVELFIKNIEAIYHIIQKKRYDKIKILFRDVPKLKFCGADEDTDGEHEKKKNSKSLKSYNKIIKHLRFLLKQIDYNLIVRKEKIYVIRE